MSRMTLMLHLSPELEAKLGEQAKATGKAPEEIALELLRAQLGGDPNVEMPLSAEAWIADVRAWAVSHRRLDRDVDDSRASIYAGRGE